MIEVGGYDFDADYVDYILNKNKDSEVHVLIDSLGGRSNTALSCEKFPQHDVYPIALGGVL